jgi:hypothetical protein
VSDIQIEMVPLGEIKPYWRNPRRNDNAVEPVKTSIVRYGFQQPLVIDKKNVIIVGHTRYRAAKELKLTEVPCIRSVLSPAQAKGYRIADNKTSEFAEWDLNALLPELRELGDAVVDMDVFFEDSDLADILDGPKKIGTVTADQIQKRDDELSEQFTDVSDKKKAAMIEVTCPHCSKDFLLRKDQIAIQPTVGDD